MLFTSRNLVAFALVAIASLAFFSVGCSRSEEPREVAPPQQSAEPINQFSRMEDPEYRKAMSERIDTRKELYSMRYRLVSQMEAKIAAAKALLGTDDEAVLKVELEKDPEWNSLYQRVVDINTALEDNHRRSVELVRERILSDIRKESAEQ